MAVNVTGVPAIANWTAAVTRSPVVITYTARDAAGNNATATRRVSVVDPCTQVRHAEQ